MSMKIFKTSLTVSEVVQTTHRRAQIIQLHSFPILKAVRAFMLELVENVVYLPRKDSLPVWPSQDVGHHRESYCRLYSCQRLGEYWKFI